MKKPVGILKVKVKNNGQTSRILKRSVASLLVAITITTTTMATAHTGWIDRKIGSQQMEGDVGAQLKVSAEQLRDRINTLKKKDFKSILTLVIQYPEFLGMVTNGVSIGFTTEEYREHKTILDMPLSINVPCDSSVIDRITKLSGGLPICQSENKTYYNICSLHV